MAITSAFEYQYNHASHKVNFVIYVTTDRGETEGKNMTGTHVASKRFR
jgi:hypothetical protein